MCGIIGITRHIPKNEFLHNVNTITHRGPDYTGIYIDKDISIGHLLLAIRGSEVESRQPVSNDTSPWVLTFNGQLYNTQQLKKLLGNDSHNTGVDTTILYTLICEYGWDFIHHIHGMFAIALYNRDEKTLKLYRDSSGQKNLYYFYDKKIFYFGSEIKSILSFNSVPRHIDNSSINIAALVGYIPGKNTLIKNLFKVSPSEIITYNVANNSLNTTLFKPNDEQYYDGMNPEEVITNVVEEHLQSKRDISINLSGGLDSSLIFHETVQSGRTIHAFSTRFDVKEEKYNRDAELAKKLAKEYSQNFTEIEITKKTYLQNFVSSYKTIEEPNFNISNPIYYQTAQIEGINGNGLRVVLSGDGGDELFGGYPHYTKTQEFKHYKKIISSFGLNMYKWMRNKNYVNYDNTAELFFMFRSLKKNWLSSDVHAKKFVTNYLKKSSDSVTDLFRQKYDDVYNLMLFDRFIWLAGENFIRSDKLYMSQSMEMRCPLAYTPLRTYMDTIINSTTYTSKEVNKIFLRKLYANKLPDFIIKRNDKTGWRAPVEIWYDQSYKKLFLDIISRVQHVECLINWKNLKKYIESSDRWPGKEVHLYLSLAILIEEYDLTS